MQRKRLLTVLSSVVLSIGLTVGPASAQIVEGVDDTTTTVTQTTTQVTDTVDDTTDTVTDTVSPSPSPSPSPTSSTSVVDDTVDTVEGTVDDTTDGDGETSVGTDLPGGGSAEVTVDSDDGTVTGSVSDGDSAGTITVDDDGSVELETDDGGEKSIDGLLEGGSDGSTEDSGESKVPYRTADERYQSADRDEVRPMFASSAFGISRTPISYYQDGAPFGADYGLPGFEDPQIAGAAPGELAPEIADGEEVVALNASDTDPAQQPVSVPTLLKALAALAVLGAGATWQLAHRRLIAQ